MTLVHNQRGRRWLEDLARDARYGVRSLRGNPMFTAVAVLTLALGIGANTTIFSLADAVLFRTLPVSKPQDLILLRQRGPTGDMFPFTSAAAANLDAGRDVLSGLAAFRPIPEAHVTVNGQTELGLMQSVSGNYHQVLGLRASVGRTLTEQDREPVAVISHRYWQRRFAGDPAVVGRVLEVQGRVFTIVGVTPPGFYGTQPGRHIDVTVPLGTQTLKMPPNARWLFLVGRLAPGVSREQALAALRVRWAQLTDVPPARPPATLELDSGAQGLNELRREFSLPLRILMAAVGMVLLLACANLAGLLVVRSSARQQEIAVRLSLGASRGRVVRQLLTESALLAAAGGVAGLALAYWAADLLPAMMSRGRASITLDVTPNARTLAFAALVTIGTIVLFGLLPAAAATRPDVQHGLKRGAPGGDGGRSRWARAMVATQVALLVLLLTSAGLFVRTLQKLHAVDAGFRQDSVLVVGVSPGPAYRGAGARALYEDLYARFSVLPDVRSVSLSMDTPLGGQPSMSGTGVAVVGRPPDDRDGPQVYHNLVGPRFFETMGIPILAGRDFEPGDDERAPKCVVVSESVARRYFPGEDPLGRQILWKDAASIVGVAKDIRYTTLRADAPLVIYHPYRQDPGAPAGSFLIRTSSVSVEALAPFLHAQIRAAAPGLPPPSVVTLGDRVAAGLMEERMLATLSSALGVLAALLAAIGIHGTVASVVARRQREIGIRMALGARPGRVARMVVRETFWIVAGGLVIGVVSALAAGLASRSLLTGVLFELSPSDPLILSGAVLVILMIAALAAYLPARRASRIDPVAAIKVLS
jgi:putative ABC transport system permease protein